MFNYLIIAFSQAILKIQLSIKFVFSRMVNGPVNVKKVGKVKTAVSDLKDIVMMEKMMTKVS